MSGRLSGTYFGGGSPTLDFDPARDFKPGEEIEVSLTRDLTSTGGGELDPAYVFRFRALTEGGTGRFVDSQTIDNRTNAVAVVAGDWEGDGDLDLAVADFGANRITILRNNGAGFFSVSSALTLQLGARALVTGDWDADGYLDLAVANSGSDSIAIFRNNRSGAFIRSPIAIAGQQGPKALSAGDWDGDGDLDLAVANFGSNSVAVLINDGTGVFAAAAKQPDLTDLIGASALASGDWDGDGDLDLASANSGNNTVAILTNDGAGVFSIESTVTDMVGAKALNTGDWNGDSHLDLAVVNSDPSSGANTVLFLINDGSGTFTPSQSLRYPTEVRALISGDWDGDGDLDLAVADFGANSVAVLENDGTGRFAPFPSGAVGGQIGVSGLAAGDFNGDGCLDLAAANDSSSSVHVLLNQP
jgi:hypothetical protein